MKRCDNIYESTTLVKSYECTEDGGNNFLLVPGHE